MFSGGDENDWSFGPVMADSSSAAVHFDKNCSFAACAVSSTL